MKRPVLAALLVVTAVAPAAVPASSPPEPLCSVCDDGFERAAAERGLTANVTHSEITVRVREDGTGRWTVRNRLENESVGDRLRSDPDLLYGIVDTALGDGHRKPDTARLSNVSADVRGRTVVVTFAYSGFADRVGGDVLLVEYFRASGRESYGLVADRFTVVGPDGSRVVNEPASGRVGAGEATADGADAGEVTWVSDDEREGYGVDSYVDDTYVAFGPREGLAQDAALRVALISRSLPTVLHNLALLVPAGVALAVGLGGYRAIGSAFSGLQPPTRLARVVLGVGLLAVVHPLYAGSVPLINGDVPALSAAGTAYVSVGGAALAVTLSRRRVPWWWLLLPAFATPLVAVIPVVLLSHPGTPWAVSESVLLGVPVALTFPLGYAVGGGDGRAKRRAAGTILAVVAALAFRFVTFTQSPAIGGLVSIIGTVLVILGLLFGVPLYLLGGSLASALEESSERCQNG
jgi:hypothetical protein